MTQFAYYRKTAFPLCHLFLAAIFLLIASYPSAAAFSPRQIIVKLRQIPVRQTGDAVVGTGVSCLDEWTATGLCELRLTLPELTAGFAEIAAILTVHTPVGADLDSLTLLLQADPGVEWVTRNYHYQTHGSAGSPDEYIPNDSLYSTQWWLSKISAPLAWDLSRGDSTVIIGIIDTGIDYLHPDLRGNIWVNSGDANSNGVDDDHNGFVDDSIGWDFVDAPDFPAGGDYLERDRDPFDEHGHGTYVAGVAAAASDNGACYASVGFNCRIMCLRAGNSQGMLEEDDVAAALLYAAQMGAAVVNMSFGDVVASPLLREAVRIAYQQGVILTGSAGNNYSQSIHYPSGYPEVIAVGATDEFDRRAAFSNHGPSVDVMAPGFNILSTYVSFDTTIHHECGEWIYPHGTSYAAPIVAAVCGLMLAINSQLTPGDAQQIIRTTADDVGSPGWDPETVNGRVNARRAVEQARFGSNVVARIVAPRTDKGVSTNFVVTGEAWGASFNHFDLYYGLGESPRRWNLVSSSDLRRYGDTLGTVELPPVDTVMIVRLETWGSEGSVAIDHVHLYVQRSAPVMDTLVRRRMLDADSYGDLVQVEVNQHTLASFLLTNARGDSLREDFGYIATSHAGVLSQGSHPGEWTVRVRLENAAGLSTISDPFDFSVLEPPFTSNLWLRTETSLSHGHLGDLITDYDCDGRPEIWRLPIEANGVIRFPLEIFEWNRTDFTATGNTYGVYLPQDVGDADGDDLLEVMGYRSRTTRIWEQSTGCGVFNQVVLSDTTMAGGRFIDLDSTDGHGEIIARSTVRENGRLRDCFAIYSVSADYQVTRIAVLPNGTNGDNYLGPPRILVGDLDADGFTDFLYGDYDGDLIFCEFESGVIVQKWTLRLPLNDASQWFDAGDTDGDGQVEWVAGCRSNSLGGTESQRRSRHWQYFVFECAGDNQFAAVDSVYILGNEDISDHPASVRLRDVDSALPAAAEILISAYPDYYIFKQNGSNGTVQPVWYFTPSASNTSLAADWDGNSLNEFFVSDGSRFVRIEAAAAFNQRPAPPAGLQGEPLGAFSVSLTWRASHEAEFYQVVRATDIPNFDVVASTEDTFVVIAAPEDVAFFYAVRSVNPLFADSFSVLSNYVPLTANRPPSVEDTAVFADPHYVLVRFSERMGASALQQWSYQLDDRRMPSVVAPAEGGRLVYLTFEGTFENRWYVLSLRGIRDAQGSRLPSHQTTVRFEVQRQSQTAPFVVSHRLLGGVTATQVEITFSEAMSSSATAIANYRADGSHRVIGVYPVQPDRSIVRVQFDEQTPVGALGHFVRLGLRGIRSERGVELDTLNGRADILLGKSSSSVSDAYVYPNPYRGAGANGEPGIMFAGLPQVATIRVFTVNGLLVRKLHHDNALGGTIWRLDNDQGEAVASGVYLYTIESGGETVRGKLALLR